MRIARDYEIKENYYISYIVDGNDNIVAVATMGILFCIDECPIDVVALTCLTYGLRLYRCNPVEMMSVWQSDDD